MSLEPRKQSSSHSRPQIRSDSRKSTHNNSKIKVPPQIQIATNNQYNTLLSGRSKYTTPNNKNNYEQSYNPIVLNNNGVK
jgi:hypothetical protein